MGHHGWVLTSQQALKDENSLHLHLVSICCGLPATNAKVALARSIHSYFWSSGLAGNPLLSEAAETFLKSLLYRHVGFFFKC